ncbi:MAG TPA: GGDEF domain-containing protein [Streptomyces sp.]|uniref:GGDEF domain-containing protein n=1 Tax=Streptomyces sp. TaxID=1931 RepID=UPI002BA9EAFB|nr:GGDEF domain-containing protein [Streptomyces sp.]HWU12088.1 GGDEF domain-containing protein [Streptomyces sp.]
MLNGSSLLPLLPLLLAVAAAWTLHARHLRREIDKAHLDDLTGLPQRRGFDRTAPGFLTRHGRHAVFLFVDLDRLKIINDTLGHPAGDRAILEAAQRMRAWAGPNGCVARLGGDEFAVATVLPAPQRTARLQELSAVLAHPFTFRGEAVDLMGATIGVAAPDLVATEDFGVLMVAADAAMYRGKRLCPIVLADPADAAGRSAAVLQ